MCVCVCGKPGHKGKVVPVGNKLSRLYHANFSLLGQKMNKTPLSQYKMLESKGLLGGSVG